VADSKWKKYKATQKGKLVNQRYEKRRYARKKAALAPVLRLANRMAELSAALLVELAKDETPKEEKST
jgi:hypothetical protein